VTPSGAFLDWLRMVPWGIAALLALVENTAILVIAVATGDWAVRRFRHRPVAEPPLPVTRLEVVAAAAGVFLNSAVTVAGLYLWRIGIISLRVDVGLRALLDVPILLLVMDALMYALHRLAHLPVLFELLHRFHHRYDRPRPLTLFALSPAEALAFGGLWLAVLSAASFSWLGISIYLGLNVAWGTIGHLGVEPVPPELARRPLVAQVAGSSFHAQHHQEIGHNFGFYTLIWDRLLGTLRPDYDHAYGRPPARQER